MAVDAACVVPMRSLGKSYDRAFKFRSKAWKDYLCRLREPWPRVELEGAASLDDLDLGFTPVDFATLDIAAACASCRIDHTIPPVADTVGGSTAGYARWDEFRARHLNRYHHKRNDAAKPESVSRMSAYLHHGHVSPLRIGREALEAGGEGADKFLDELFVWRELAHNFCFYRTLDDPSGASLETSAALPDWAVQTLRSHRSDERPHTYSWDELAHARTHSSIWNACQHSLLRHGELHNNLRMTWGKAIALWTRSPGVALDVLIDINHRYALDGNNPNSYGGLLWCLGQFDRPFEPEQPVIGTVRGRDPESHAQRLNLNRYTSWVTRSSRSGRQRIAVVGGGLAGLMAARVLTQQGHTVTVFEKSRGPGGRTATRYASEQRFDHGPPWFRFDDQRLLRMVKSWVEQGIIARLDDNADRYVGTPQANSLAGHLAMGLDDFRTSTRVSEITRDAAGGLRLSWSDGKSAESGRFDSVILAIPSVQAVELAAPLSAPLARMIGQAEMAPRWTAMIETDAVSAKVLTIPAGHPDLESIIHNSAKPGRPDLDGISAWVVHASADFSERELESSKDDIADTIRDKFNAALSSADIDAPVRSVHVHRWRYAFATHAASDTLEALTDPDLPLFVCGDWVHETRSDHGVQGALLSGMAAAGRLLGRSGPERDLVPDNLFGQGSS
jgi:predicted NAD/FAD-dependent oxidoreductase